MGGRRRNVLVIGLVLGLLAASAIVIATQPTVLGLDLRGGTQLVYQARATPQTPQVTPDAIDRAINIIRTRTDKFGVSEPEISRLGTTGIQVGLPNVQNAQQAIDQIGTTAQLYFYDLEANIVPPPKKGSHGSGEHRRPQPERLHLPEPVRGGQVRLEAKARVRRQQMHHERAHLLPVRQEVAQAAGRPGRDASTTSSSTPGTRSSPRAPRSSPSRRAPWSRRRRPNRP